MVRIGKVTNVYLPEGKAKVVYEDEGNVSIPLPVIVVGAWRPMPSIGERVVTVHMENGSSKGFILGGIDDGVFSGGMGEILGRLERVEDKLGLPHRI